VQESIGQQAGFIPNLDSIAEFRIISSNADAEFGGYSGGLINVVTKSGEDTFHGSAFEFLRNTGLDARGYFSPERSTFQQNQYGGNIWWTDQEKQSLFLRRLSRSTHSGRNRDRYRECAFAALLRHEQQRCLDDSAKLLDFQMSSHDAARGVRMRPQQEIPKLMRMTLPRSGSDVVCTSAVRFRKTFAAFAGSDGQKLDSERGIAHGVRSIENNPQGAFPKRSSE